MLQPRQKYTDDPFEALEILSDDSRGQEDIPQVDSEEDDEFTPQANPRVPSGPNLLDSEDEDAEGGTPRATASAVKRRRLGTPQAVKAIGTPGTPETPSRAASHGFTAPPSTSQRFFSRGVPELARHAGKKDHFTSLFGSGAEDLASIISARDKWSNGPTLPQREKDKYGFGGLGYSFFYTEDQRKQEASKGWNWYYEQGGRQAFEEDQRMETLATADGEKYLPRSSNSDRKFLMGPYGKQRMFNLPVNSHMDIEAGWRPASQACDDGVGNGTANEIRRPGWILNVGCKVQCMDWAPNQGGELQFLAISTFATKKTAAEEAMPVPGLGEPVVAPAFAPSRPSTASIQIWRFSSLPNGKPSMDPEQSPKLQMVICTDWGGVKQFRWCPTLRETRETEQEGFINLGLLAGVWADGRVRVLDVRCPIDPAAAPHYLHVTNVAFEARPPDAICTCVDWISSSDLAVGCANGFVAIWSFVAHLTSRPSKPAFSPVPWYYEPHHETYILSIASSAPSRPHLIMTSSMDGYIRLSSLRAPAADTVLSTRCRLGTTTLAWSDHMQALLAAEESNTIRSYALRRFFSSASVARQNALVLSLATAATHPMFLAGGADGSVLASNPIRKVLNPKSTQYQQYWFKHEWTRHGDKGGNGISRFLEGFKLESAVLLKSQEGSAYATIFEEETGVSAVAWNPNLRCGSWAAAGMGSGLVRVEDLAVG
ncbi:MAG: hypothetical protein M1819_004811 [Sarea resinae]|nr:MAG: hypothetical protein M1819_004811 [Sarea resinae]